MPVSGAGEMKCPWGRSGAMEGLGPLREWTSFVSGTPPLPFPACGALVCTHLSTYGQPCGKAESFQRLFGDRKQNVLETGGPTPLQAHEFTCRKRGISFCQNDANASLIDKISFFPDSYAENSPGGHLKCLRSIRFSRCVNPIAASGER